MKKNISLILLLVMASVFNSFGQKSKSLNSNNAYGETTDAYIVKNKYNNAKLIKETTLLVVLDKDTTTSLSKLITKAIKDNWTFSKYSFISKSDIKSYESKEGYSIFDVYSKVDNTKSVINNKSTIVGYSYIIRSAINNKANTDFIAEFNLPCSVSKDKKKTLLNYEYLLPIIVQTFQAEQDYNYKTEGKVPKDYKERIHGTAGGQVTYYNDGKIKMPKTKIYVSKEGIKCENAIKQSLAKYLKVDESQLIYANSDELKKIIATKDDNTAIFVNGDVYSLKDTKRIASSQVLQQIYGDCSD